MPLLTLPYGYCIRTNGATDSDAKCCAGAYLLAQGEAPIVMEIGIAGINGDGS